MNLEILSIDGMALAAEAWRLSRDVEVPIQWQDVYTVDSPCNEMPSAVVHFRDLTILEREIFASSRTHVMWARTSFVDSPEKYQLPVELLPFCDFGKHDQIRRKMAEGKAAGQHQDEWRRFLPVSALTCFVMRVSYRDAIKYAKYFKYLADHRFVQPALQSRFLKISARLIDLINQFTGSTVMTDKAMNLMSLPKLLCEELFPIDGRSIRFLTDRLDDRDDDFDEIVVRIFEVPFWIRAHFIRHRPISIADSLFELLKRKDICDLPISEPVTIQVAATRDIWTSLLGKRSCWLTQSTLSAERDPWQEIVEQFGTQVLPCAGGECPYHKDARNRIAGTDPGVPCPRYLHLNRLDAAPHLRRIRQALPSRASYWEDETRLAMTEETRA